MHLLIKRNLLLILIEYQIWNGQEPLNSTPQPLNMQLHAEPSKPHQTFLKEGEGDGMGMNRGKGELREIWWN